MVSSGGKTKNVTPFVEKSEAFVLVFPVKTGNAKV